MELRSSRPFKTVVSAVPAFFTTPPDMDSSTSYAPPTLFPDQPSAMDVDNSGDQQDDTSQAQPDPDLKTRDGSDNKGPSGGNGHTGDKARVNEKTTQKGANTLPLPLDLAMAVKGMYRLLDLINESGSNGFVEKVIIAQESLERFVNAMCPGAFASITKVDFKALDRLTIKPLGVYGSKGEIVRMLRSIGAVDDNIARLLLQPTEPGGNRPALSSGLYVVTTSSAVSVDERHYIIYWPEDSTWDDGATSSVRRNRVTFMRYLTKICDQVVALLSSEQSASIVWHDEDSDTESVDVDVGESDRLFIFGVEKTNEQDEGAVSRPGFKMISRQIEHYVAPDGCPVDPSIFVPRLLGGEAAQGFLTATYVQRKMRSEILGQRPLTRLYLTQLLNENSVVLSEALDEKAIEMLVDLAFGRIFPEQCAMWKTAKKDIREKFKKEATERSELACRDLLSREESLRRGLRGSVVDEVMKLYPSIGRDSLATRVRPEGDPDVAHEGTDWVQIDDLRLVYPGFDSLYQRHLEKKFDTVKGSDFKFLKERLMLVRHLLGKNQDLDPEKRGELIRALLSEGNLHEAQKMLPNSEKKESGLIAKALRIVPFFGGHSDVESEEEALKQEMKKIARAVSDSDFLLGLKSIEIEGLQPAIQEAETLAHTSFSSLIDTTVKTMTHAVLNMQLDTCKKEIQKDVQAKEARALSDALLDFIRDLNSKSVGRRNSVLRLDSVERSGRDYYWSSSSDYKVSGRREAPEEPKLEFWVHHMDLSSEDKHNMQSNRKHIPHPTVNTKLSSRFYIPIGLDIAFHRLLENEKLLLILVDRERFSIYLARPAAMDATIKGNPLKTLNRDKLGLGGDSDALFAFDEAKRTLAVCSSVKLQLHAFVFDETFKTLQGQGSAINLGPWYSQADISIEQVSFVCGNDEVVLVDSSAQVRIFSFVTLQFRPASVQLQSLPSAIYSSPDGSCLLVLQIQDSGLSLTAYHWETFGSTNGILLEVPEFPFDGAVLTSMCSRGNIFLLGLDVDAQCVKSIAIDITKKVTEFLFKEKGYRNSSNDDARQTVNNSLLDCHKEVWTRFPIVAAVGRQTITSLSERRRKSLTFITENPTKPFSSYFSDLIHTFERTTRKPAGNELRRIEVSAADSLFRSEPILESNWNVSRYCVGEWLVDLLCLIPIHIAVCRENRFVPLADGVLSAELERSLLGAEVNKIVDKLSFGWYESIFKSYMASKPVKVVSSMGQQSVGKSFSLNHLVDTSFAGSAMRTTEGVWMSVTPTDDALIVALDFEGVDSVERSPQEDMLLVLFNTAISNLVLFRNNFAFSRDISGLFQSFQSSASVLDPAANPTLFQSTLMIIIKDVVESDKLEITREFSTKFQKIVQQEQDANFISRLHGGKLEIIPWPVIESKEFYKLFATLKRRLDLQKISHSTAGEFLHTIKTLMAKLKANDWGALSQTMAEHRARSLSALLPIALGTGYSEIEPDLEPLKNFDTDLPVESDDTEARFVVSNREQILPGEIEKHLLALLESWTRGPITPRQSISDAEWIAALASYLQELADLRINHVRLWLDSNLEKFQGGPAAIDDLHRKFDNMVIQMKTNVQLCRAQCASCHLFCVRGLLHEGDHSCGTGHQCAHNCEFCEDGPKLCGTPAGHPGKHICVVNAHLCGEPCKLLGKRGCLEECTRVLGHSEDEHVCSALVHMCGMPCDLSEITLPHLPEGKTYSCPELCTIPSDQEHETHSCDTRLCPAACELCKRLCDKPHLHGVDPHAHHLCGCAHSCSAPCSAPGTCQIDTSPHSVEATFTGRHEKYQYTKYTQVAKRLQCVKTIPPGQTSHEGAHIHSKEKNPFHFCKESCKNCNYFCTLPLGHQQREHETSHGSMTQTRWAVDGPDGTSLELGGRKYSSNDEGAPMMCNLVCSSLGRHVHVDYCRPGEDGTCDGAEVQHIGARILPNPNKPKDWVTHGLSWRRTGASHVTMLIDCYRFMTRNRIYTGPEHSAAAAGGPGQPSYCTLPMFHPPRNPNDPVTGLGYTSNDGHLFECRNPVVMQQAFHVIFVIDRSGSMSSTDRRPLPNAPATNQITRSANNRLGAVYSALYSFWSARHAAVTAGQQSVGARRDAYSIILFNENAASVLDNDFTSSPDQLLTVVLASHASGGTNFAGALRAGQTAMTQHWSTERTPVMIFLSDGECSVPDSSVQDVCRSAVQLGRVVISLLCSAGGSLVHRKPLSFHSVSFGPDSSSSSLRRMAQLALEIQNNAPRGRGPATTSIPSSFTVALDTVQLAQTFLGIAESLRKPRGSLIH
ncbi:hypothetical protein H4582DRAFT_1855657 [Lactarius indigo]|nr:hypothetical protein H4582DRAFT_1855657 [Lactarius indigo]